MWFGVNFFRNECLIDLFVRVEVDALMVVAEWFVVWESVEGVVAFIDFFEFIFVEPIHGYFYNNYVIDDQLMFLFEKIYDLNLYISADTTTAPIPNPTYFFNPFLFSSHLIFYITFFDFISVSFINGSRKNLISILFSNTKSVCVESSMKHVPHLNYRPTFNILPSSTWEVELAITNGGARPNEPYNNSFN